MFKLISFIAVLGVVCTAEDPLRPGDRMAHPICTQRNGYYAVDGSCDSYIECRNSEATEMLCPDGLHYNPEAPWPSYPCGYPMDVPCKGRGVAQPAQPTAECPRQYGFYPSLSASPENCGEYRMCVEGRAIDMMCPPGLAFNSETARCDWPDLVPSCDAEAFLGIRCPPPQIGDDGLPLEIIYNYKYPHNCYSFYSCEAGRARLLSCDAGYVFSSDSGRCESEDIAVCENDYIPL